MKVLVAHGSEHGGTAGIAEQIATAMRAGGLTVDVHPASEVRDVRSYEAVVLGGALYALHWQASARRFVLRHHAELLDREVHFFSSGPLDDSASQRDIAPTHEVAQLMAYVGARSHTTFGGRLAPDASGMIASGMAKKHAGDWRDPARVEAWARALGERLRASSPATRTRSTSVPLPSRAVALGLALFTGLSALGGGAVLVASPDGAILHMPTTVLAHSPFHDFFWPGVILATLVGLLNLYAAWRQRIRDPYAPFVSFAAGASLSIWVVVEMIMLGSAHWLQLAYLVVGVATLVDAGLHLRALFATWGAAAHAPAAPATR